MAALLGLAATPAQASLELAQASRCGACHQVDRKVVGPAFREIGRRYGATRNSSPGGNAEMAAYLARKIRQGGSGAWGAVPMAANPHVSEADALRLAQWVLTLK
ncbi:MAG: c-type cytochrome [Rubrivivax sp.]